MKARHALLGVMAGVLAGLMLPVQGSGQFVSSLGFSSNDTSTVTAMGVGEVAVAPERAVVYIQIESADTEVSAAAMANGATRAGVMERLASIGFGEESVSLWGYGAGPAINRGRLPAPGTPGSDPGFEAKSGLRVVVRPMSRIDEVIAAALAAGASSIPMVALEAGDSEAARREAAAKAVAKARVAAEAIAEAAGGRLGKLVRFAVVPDYQQMIPNRFFQTGMMNSGVQVFPYDVTVTVQVQATWVFEPN